MTVAGLLLFLVGVFSLRMIGGFVLGGLIGDNERFTRLLALLPLSIVSGVIAIQTFGVKQDLVIDARVVGVGLAALGAWKKLPMGLLVLIAAVSTALVRKAGWLA